MSYDMIDRFLRNNLGDDDYAEYSEALDSLCAPPAQPLPFGVGGALVAIKTLLSRDPCAHANTAIEMIDAILAEQPAQRKPLTDEAVFSMAEIAWRHGWASCRDAEYVGEGAEDERWGEIGAEVVQSISAHNIKENT